MILYIGDEVGLYSMMATSFGKLDKFDPELGKDWIQYVERMEYYLQANGISATEKQRAILLSAMDAKTYRILQNVITSTSPSDKSFTELEVLTKHLSPSPSKIVQ